MPQEAEEEDGTELEGVEIKMSKGDVLKRFVDGYPIRLLPEDAEEVLRTECSKMRDALNLVERQFRTIMKALEKDSLQDCERWEQIEWVRHYSTGEAHGKMLAVQMMSLAYNDFVRMALE